MSVSVPKAFAWIGMILAGAAIVIFLSSGSGGNHYYVYAKFKDAGGLQPKFFVKVAQVQAGTVKSIKLNKAENEVTVKMQLDHGAYPIGEGATAAVRPVNLLGEKYVQLTTGDLNRPVKSGYTIPESRTSIPVELDDIFNTLDPETRGGLGIIINEAGLAMAGQGANFMSTLRDLPPTLSSAKAVVGEIAGENTALEQAIVQGNQDLQAVNGNKLNLQNLIESGQSALTSINTARTQLGQTLDAAPGGLAQLRTSLASLQQASDALTPAAANLNRATPQLATTLERLPDFTSEATAALNEAKQVAPQLQRLGAQSAPILKQIRPAAASLATFATTFQPFVNTLDQGSGLKNFLGFVDNWSKVTDTRDGLGHLFRLRISVDQTVLTDTLRDYEGLAGLNKTAAKTGKTSHAKHTPATKSAGSTQQTPAPTQKGNLGGTLSGVLGQAGSNLNNTLNGVKNGLGNVVNKVLDPSASTTGSSSTSSSTTPSNSPTSRLLHFLLGS